jgi:hypothetical protein
MSYSSFIYQCHLDKKHCLRLLRMTVILSGVEGYLIVAIFKSRFEFKRI